MSVEYRTKSESRLARERKTIAIERELDLIARDNGGSVSSRLLLERAMDPKNELHDRFEWDDKICGERYRLTQATAMILATKYIAVMSDEKDGLREVLHASAPAKLDRRYSVRKFISTGDGAYKPREVALNNQEDLQRIIERKLAVLRSWSKSVVDIHELDPVRTAIDSILKTAGG
jgi:hypothetical protein